MDGWVDGWIDGWIGEWIGGGDDEHIHGWISGGVDVCMAGSRWMDMSMDGRIAG